MISTGTSTNAGNNYYTGMLQRLIKQRIFLSKIKFDSSITLSFSSTAKKPTQQQGEKKKKGGFDKDKEEAEALNLFLETAEKAKRFLNIKNNLI
jgi:hypothetical protein